MFNNDEEYMDSLKKDDHYHFSIPFTYIKKNYGNDQYDDGTAIMEVDVDWNESQHGYSISHHCPEMYLIDPEEGNGTEDDFWEDTVYFEVKDQLDSIGIPAEALIFGGLWP